MSSVFGIYQNADLIEGRGPMVLRSVFKNEHDAYKAMESYSGVFGSRFGVVVNELVVYNSFDEFKEEKNGELRQKALAKLTEAEKQILGL